MQAEHQIRDLTSSLKQLELQLELKKDSNSILDMIDVESFENLDDFTRFYAHLRAKVKAAKQKKAKLKQERQMQEQKSKYDPTLLLSSLLVFSYVPLFASTFLFLICKQDSIGVPDMPRQSDHPHLQPVWPLILQAMHRHHVPIEWQDMSHLQEECEEYYHHLFVILYLWFRSIKKGHF